MLHSGENDSIEMSLELNEAMAEIEMNQAWCNDCQVLKQSLDDLRAACNQKANIISDLKEKIIPTDQLITDFYIKQEENQMLTRSLETSRRQCEELGQQLHSALARLEPLREANAKCERHLQRGEQDIEKLKAENEAYKICQHQSNLAHNALLEKVRKLEEERKEGQASFRRSESRVKKLQGELLVNRLKNKDLNKVDQLGCCSMSMIRTLEGHYSRMLEEELVVRKKEYSQLKKENGALEHEVRSLTILGSLKILKLLSGFDDAKLAKFKNFDVPSKSFLKNCDMESSNQRVSEISGREISSLLNCSILEMLPAMLSPLPCSEADLSDADASDNDPSIDHFASQLEATLGCSDDNVVRLPDARIDDDVPAKIDEGGDDEGSGDKKTDIIMPVDKKTDIIMPVDKKTDIIMPVDKKKDIIMPVDEVNSLIKSRKALTKSRLASQMSTGFDTITDETDRVPQVASGGTKGSCFTSSLTSVPSTLEFVPPNPLVQNSATEVEASVVFDHSAATCRPSSSSDDMDCDDDAPSASVPPLDIIDKSQDVSSDTQPLSCPVSENRSLGTGSSVCSTLVVPSSSASAVVAPPSSVSISSCAVICPADFYSSLYSLRSVSSLASMCLSSVIPKSTPVRTAEMSVSPIISSDVAASSNVPGVYSAGAALSSATACGAAEIALLPSAYEIPVISATHSRSSGSVLLSSTVILTQCASAVIIDNVLQSTSRVSDVNSGASKVLLLPTSADAVVLPSKTVPLCSPCVPIAASSIVCGTLPCDSAVISSTLNTSSSSVSVVTCNSVPLCSPGVAAKTSSATHRMSLRSCVSGATSTTCYSVSASTPSATLSNFSNIAPLSSHCASVLLPTSMPFSSCANKLAASEVMPLASLSKIAICPAEADASLDHSLLRSQISVEDIFSHVNIPPPLSPIRSPRNDARVRRKRSESRRLAAVKQILSLPVTDQPVEPPMTSMLGICPVPNKVRKVIDVVVEALLVCDESDKAAEVQGDETQLDSAAASREKSMETNAVSKQTLPVISHTAGVLPTIQKSNTSDLIEAIIKEVLMLTEDVIPMWFNRCVGGRTSTSEPWLTPSQQRLLTELFKPADPTILHEFCRRAVQVLSSKADLFITGGITALCCIFVAICRYLGDVERVRVFVFDAVKCQFPGYATLITAVAAIWPFPLHVANCSPDFSTVLHVLQHAIMAKSLDSSKPKHLKIQFCLEKLCGWSLPSVNADDIARSLLAYLNFNLKLTPALSQEVTWNVELAFDLLCVTDGWQWSNNFVVVQLLWPILASWAANPAAVLSQPFVEAVIDILGSYSGALPDTTLAKVDSFKIAIEHFREPLAAGAGLVMSHCPATCRSNTDHILNVLLKLLKEPTVAVGIQISVLRALLLLAKYQPDCCATMCLQWVKDHKKDLDNVTKTMLRDFHKQFSSRLKYLGEELVID